ncbi:MAG: type II toxin-antitoxin system VapB family antitoxin [Candidatus Freyarchaeota archaeon]
MQTKQKKKNPETQCINFYHAPIIKTFITRIPNLFLDKLHELFYHSHPPEIKNEMDKLKDEINRSKEISESIKSKIQEQKKRKALQEAVAYIQTLPEAPKGTAQKLVRKDRDTR